MWDLEEQRKIEDSLKACREIQEYLKREKRENKNSIPGMNFGTRSEIDRILSDYAEKTEKQEENSEEPKKEEPPVVTPPIEEPPVEDSPVEDSPVEDSPVVKTPVVKIPVVEEKTEEEIEEETEEEYNERHPFLRALFHVLICVAVALILSLLITKFVAHHTSVEGSSMETTLANSDQLIVENVSYYLHEPERFDVVVFPYCDGVNYIKRIIGLPGESVLIENGCIYINGKLLDENYGREAIEDPGLAAEEIVLGEDEYFVLGDNRNASIDSRREEVGNVHRSDIKGKAWLRFYPMNRVGLIE